MSKPEKENGQIQERGGELLKKSYILLLDLLKM